MGDEVVDTMWSSPDGVDWTAEILGADVAIVKSATAGGVIWAVEAVPPSPGGRVSLWARADEGWREMQTPVPWSVDSVIVAPAGDGIWQPS